VRLAGSARVRVADSRRVQPAEGPLTSACGVELGPPVGPPLGPPLYLLSQRLSLVPLVAPVELHFTCVTGRGAAAEAQHVLCGNSKMTRVLGSLGPKCSNALQLLHFTCGPTPGPTPDPGWTGPNPRRLFPLDFLADSIIRPTNMSLLISCWLVNPLQVPARHEVLETAPAHKVR
jgi:hypothetical protein